MTLTEEQVERLIGVLEGVLWNSGSVLGGMSKSGWRMPLGENALNAVSLLVEIGRWERLPGKDFYRPKPTPADAGEG